MHHDAPDTSLAAAVALGALLAVVVVCLALGLVRRQWRWAVLAGVAAGALFQLAHFGEHVAQAGYWTAHSDKAPWMTPWAAALARSFGRLAPGTPAFGMEALHLVGNTIFLTGALAIYLAVLRDGPPASQRPACAGVAVQSVHVLEHVALTVSVLVGSRPRGISTGFGLLDPGPGLWTYRVWWHLTINAAATALLTLAVIRWRRSAAAPPPQPSTARPTSHDRMMIKATDGGELADRLTKSGEPAGLCVGEDGVTIRAWSRDVGAPRYDGRRLRRTAHA